MSLTFCASSLVGDEHRVVGLDHDRVAQAQHRDHSALGADIAVRAPSCRCTSPRGTLPLASFAPTSHSVVHEPTSLQPMSTGTHRGVRRSSPSPRSRSSPPGTRRTPRRRAAGNRDRSRASPTRDGTRRGSRADAAELLEIAPGAEHEHAAVPGEVPPIRGTSRPCRRVGLLDEPCDAIAAVVTGERLAALDVAVAGRRLRSGRMPKVTSEPACAIARSLARPRHETPRRRGSDDRPAARAAAARDRVVATCERGDRHGRRGVAADRLEDLRAFGAMSISRSCSATRKRCSLLLTTIGGTAPARPAQAQRRVSCSIGPLGDERQELLGQQSPRHRPEPAAGAAQRITGKIGFDSAVSRAQDAEDPILAVKPLAPSRSAHGPAAAERHGGAYGAPAPASNRRP